MPRKCMSITHLPLGISRFHTMRDTNTIFLVRRVPYVVRTCGIRNKAMSKAWFS